MCGIVGGVLKKGSVVPFLIEGLKRLEYRGYDSSGIAVLNEAGKIERVRRVGRVEVMADAAHEALTAGRIGVGHTRWATHGGVTEPNAHPHISYDTIVVVHNGIIENYEKERERLEKSGYEFTSQTDTEVIAHAIYHEYSQDQQRDLFAATARACQHFQGAFAIAVMAKDQPETLVVVRMGCPLLIGLCLDQTLIASDVSAVIAQTRRVIYLEDGDIAKIGSEGIEVLHDRQGKAVTRRVQESNLSPASLELGPYSHFMQKEIHEQPQAIAATAEPLIDERFAAAIFGSDAESLFQKIRGIKILACGTSYYAALAGKYWLESLARIPVDAEIASEYRYRDVLADENTLVLTLSQSGETLDTLEALKYAKEQGHRYSMSICNVMESAIARASDYVFYTRAGVEVGVASTKAFTTQLVALFGLAVALGKVRGLIDEAATDDFLDALRRLPGSVQHALNMEPELRIWAEAFAQKNHALYLGRGIHYPIALEGALKLKEITYIHAEAYPAGELKHGPLALVDHNMPVVVIAPNDKLLDKIKGNMQEVKARGGRLYVLTDNDSDLSAAEGMQIIRTPREVGILSPIVHVVGVQLLAYHTALVRGTDVDKPRNLAKAVTVE